MRRILRGMARFFRQRMSWVRSIVNITLVGLLALTLLSAWVPTTAGSSPVLKIWQQQLQKPDRSVERLGNLEVAPVRFEGSDLFTIVSPTVWDRTQPGSQLPVEARAAQVEANLQRVIDGSFIPGQKDGILTNFDPKTLQVSIVSLNEIPVIVASDSYHTQPLNLVTVTYLDASHNGQPIGVLAERWRSLIYQSLYAALMDRSPEALSLRGKLGESLVVLGVMLAASALLWLLQLPLKRRNHQLRLQQAAIAADIPLSEAGAEALESLNWQQMQEHFLNGFQRQMQLQRQRHVVGFFRWLLAWGQLAIWITGFAVAALIFPWTKQLAWFLLGSPTVVLFIWFLTSICNRFVGMLLQGAAEVWVKFGTSATNYPQRDGLRIFTILSALKPVKTLGIYAAGIAITLVYLGLPFSLVLTIAGIVALALILICQGFVRDWVTGGLMLWEDQYAIGDIISIDHHTGLVERMNLRLTQLRSLEGGLISIANGTISRVENLTRYWRSRVIGGTTSPKGQQGTRLSLENSNSGSFVDPEVSESPIES